jgi:hypothetical protein
MSGEHWPPGASWPNTGRSPRQEAERLVAAALAAASIAARSTAGFATGSAECCVCPVCRALTAMRDPTPEFAERLATGAGDLAVGLASILRAFAGPDGPVAAPHDSDADPEPAADPVPETPGQRRDPDQWPSTSRASDRDPGRDVGAGGDAETDPWQAATRAPDTSAPEPNPLPEQSTAPAPKPVAKKAVRPAARLADDGASLGA